MPTWNHINLQNSNNPMMEQLIFFHDHTMMILIIITLFVSYMLVLSILNKNTNMELMENQMIETVWTVTPMLILIFITIPSLRILYLMEEVNNPLVSIKSMGHQWYWSYEYSDFFNVNFDSFMLNYDDSLVRLLEVDNRMIVPMNAGVRMLTSSSDVIHSWTIPSLGVKMDSIPGRVNQSIFNSSRPGIYVGQCSEICGANHSFMPIVMESVNIFTFMNWVKMNS
uniref:Cytochrome c oxidase subunit 2 n=2 Tax=Tanystylum orbiculare TaxID=88027 RepID=E0XLE2_TANOR|nr:cytochrome c oxidase subunit II [Tanystylum orbiculare]ADB91987.1 cytochrome c oxidase subunit II [Tanystylum orbiculare]